MTNQMLRFGLVGVAGYLVDTIVLYSVWAMGLGYLRGRLLSFVCAVIATWLLNRRYTFAQELSATAVSERSLLSEFGRYLMAMSLGGFLNLATYWVVIALAPRHPAVPALGVAAGSLAGMAANFATAKWWVYRNSNPLVLSALRLPTLTTSTCLVMAQIAFWICHFRDMALPGIYMDAANPDYLAARTLNPDLNNPVYLLPTVLFPILGNLYHGVQNYYVSLPVFAVLGFNMLALRIAQGLFGSGIVVVLHFVLRRATGSQLLALAGSVCLATELAFLGSFRTQFYIVVSGSFWLLLAVYLAFGSRSAKRVEDDVSTANHLSSKDRFIQIAISPLFWSGVCVGLAVYSYFVFLFFVPVFVIMGWWHTRSWWPIWSWSLGFVLGMQTYVLGYVSMIIAMGGLGPTIEMLTSASQDLAPMSSELSFLQSLVNAWWLTRIAVQNGGNEAMIFGIISPGLWPVLKVGLWIIALLCLIAMSFFKSSSAQRQPFDGTSGLLAYRHVVWLPIAFVAVASVFGNRLWAHHFSPLVPLMYLTLFLGLYQVKKSLPFALPRWVWGTLVVCLLVGNLHQQTYFFERLEATGGTGGLSNALNRMAEDALSLPPELVHVFPEWGFFIPFALLTGNERPYEIYMTPENLQRLANEQKTVRLYHWKAEDGDMYRENLRAQGFEVNGGGSYNQRDQQTAFLWIDAVGTNPN